MKTDVKLPDKPSELIRVALADLEKCERSNKYRINMDDWYTMPDNDGVCRVCFAGVVMAQTSKREPLGDCELEVFDEHEKYYALNDLRIGYVSWALGDLGLPVTGDFDRDIAYYDEDPKQFKADMRKLADDLEAAGL